MAARHQPGGEARISGRWDGQTVAGQRRPIARALAATSLASALVASNGAGSPGLGAGVVSGRAGLGSGLGRFGEQVGATFLRGFHHRIKALDLAVLAHLDGAEVDQLDHVLGVDRAQADGGGLGFGADDGGVCLFRRALRCGFGIGLGLLHGGVRIGQSLFAVGLLPVELRLEAVARLDRLVALTTDGIAFGAGGFQFAAQRHEVGARLFQFAHRVGIDGRIRRFGHLTLCFVNDPASAGKRQAVT